MILPFNINISLNGCESRAINELTSLVLYHSNTKHRPINQFETFNHASNNDQTVVSVRHVKVIVSVIVLR